MSQLQKRASNLCCMWLKDQGRTDISVSRLNAVEENEAESNAMWHLALLDTTLDSTLGEIHQAEQIG
jgi:hypothetical protein